ncbi:Ppx/GppA phosphatase family protein [Taklimakanibacter deserti]|uniref:Ppx/GppA phosphatase family protein n=1 Tax=Taklimakanibacter deserti TaxID=2267839 RepID=UPI0013C40770
MDARSGVGEARARRHGNPNGSERPRKGDHGAPPRQRPETGDAFYGALDLGTNNCRLLIAAPSPSGFTVVDAFSRIVRLGEGLTAAGHLSEAAMKRTIDALRICANKLTWHRVGRHRLVATEACRMAANGDEFIARVKEEVGLELEIIGREMEAKLAAVGAEPLIEAGASSALVFDIGGGSTELMWLEQRQDRHEIVTWISLAAGVVTVSERFGGVDVDKAKYQAMRDHLKPLIVDFAQRVRSGTGGAAMPAHLLGTSGTVTTIAGVQLGLRRYDRARVDGCWLTQEAIAQVCAELLGLSYGERMDNACIGRDRADLVLAGCAILEEICAAFPAPRIRVADRGLREGILTLMMKTDGTFGRAL